MRKELENIINSEFRYEYKPYAGYYKHEFAYGEHKRIRICIDDGCEDPTYIEKIGVVTYIDIHPKYELEFQQWLRLLSA